MDRAQIQERKKELVDILLDSVYYLDLDLVERKRLLCFLMERFAPGSDNYGIKAA